MSSDDIVISVRNLTKTYRIFGHPGDRLKQALSLGLRRYHKEFTALKDISFDIRKGETVGIIGRNGSGKSTLLQIICGILKPTSGTVQVNGRVSALLELGAGFNPEFTGRENVYFQGALMGFAKEQMDERFDEIAAFADIGDFIDQPVRTYSSGMFVRLAFSAATHVNPQILIVDEALAVGDHAFQKKCFERMVDLANRNNTSIIVVSHNIRQIERFCMRALLLDKGNVIANNESAYVCNRYYDLIDGDVSRKNTDLNLSEAINYRSAEYLKILGIDLVDAAGNTLGSIKYLGDAIICIRLSLTQQLSEPVFAIGVQAPDSVYLATIRSAASGLPKTLECGEHKVFCRISGFPLLPGTYKLRMSVSEGKACTTIMYGESLAPIIVENIENMNRAEISGEGYVPLSGAWEVKT
jgi:ABC-type polysaccharide/polyol phosphate transport system ATPase subunit